GALARRAPSPNVANWAAPLDRKRDFDASDETELMRRAIDGLSSDLHALEERSTSVLATADGQVDVQAELTTAFTTCTDTVVAIGAKIKASIAACGHHPSAFKVVAAVKADLSDLRIAVAALATATVKVYASTKVTADVTVSVVANLLVNLLVAVHVALADIVALVATAPLLVILLAGELLAISAQLVVCCNTLFVLLGTQLKVAVASALSVDVFVGLKALGFTSLLAIIQI
ncbi:hypothetical protein JCM11641_002668, partial [Rhodosporidiobolus odoratus]